MRTLRDLSKEELRRALEFYLKSPDGQYDEIAVLCIQHVLMMKGG